ncbi:hypothetical protein PNEG_00391 [Pneumocystis murina B123]|uniref:non-specific serine/threonine protein kinase n=1 Tax=Pneumocystis murina (strain B123) TaxID=1069680 RepID=M7PLN6_PNEMU|nr:hypothetical protein PNEG_00391 [Pneumocystis murina B123]EMR11364.1 hypothetical protein PNEG_00391 [Pneumocystis murina B123]
MTIAKPLYTLQELIGRGSYGAVYKGIHNETKQVVAIKVLNLDTTEDDVADIQREISMLSQLKQVDAQNVVRYHGSFLYDTRLWVIMDFCEGGSIRTLMKSCRIEEKYLSVIIREILIALNYIHRSGIIHRDIKAANILITNDGRVQLCDFGVAAQLTANNFKRNTFVGTPYWMAPEVITEGASYNFKADIWSLGITIYEIATGNPPFADQEPMRAIILIPRSPPTRLEGTQFSSQLKDFVAICLNEDVNERPSAMELLKTKFIKQTMKTPTSILKELLIRYELWCQHAGIRKSLNANVNDKINDENFEFDNMDNQFTEEWTFDTVQGYPDTKTFDIEDKNSLNKHEKDKIYLNETLKNKSPNSNNALNNTKMNHPLLQLFVQESEKTEPNTYITSSLINSSKNFTKTDDFKDELNQISIDISNIDLAPSLACSLQNDNLKSQQLNSNSLQPKIHSQTESSQISFNHHYSKSTQSNPVVSVDYLPRMIPTSPLQFPGSTPLKPSYSCSQSLNLPSKSTSSVFSSKIFPEPQLNSRQSSKSSNKNKHISVKDQSNTSNSMSHALDQKIPLLNTKSQTQNISPVSKYSGMDDLIFLPPSPSQPSISPNFHIPLKDSTLSSVWKNPPLIPLNLEVLSDYANSGGNTTNNSIINELEKVLLEFQNYLEVLDKGLSIIQKNSV